MTVSQLAQNPLILEQIVFTRTGNRFYARSDPGEVALRQAYFPPGQLTKYRFGELAVVAQEI